MNKWTVSLGALLLLLLVRGAFWYQEELSYRELVDATVLQEETVAEPVEIAAGSSLRTIAAFLEESNIVVDAAVFERYVRSMEAATSLQAGTFYLSGSMTIPEVVDVLTGKVVPDEVRLTIREGLTILEIADLFVERGLATKEEVLDCITSSCDFSAYDFLPTPGAEDAYAHSYMEGYLFPDTYYIAPTSFDLESFLGRLLRTFESRVLTPFAEEIAESEYTQEELVVLASIMEKESRPSDDQHVVAGVFFNRLENGVQLALDATTRYIKDDPLAPLTAVELASSNPYNTRRVRGIPPTAISNFGVRSFEAILNPEDTNYWYYLHDANGQIHYSSTEAEHNRKKALYLN